MHLKREDAIAVRQDVPTQAGCENDTLVEPDIAVSPFNPSIAVAVAHDCRFANGGAVDISYAWTHDRGATWHHAPLPDLTRAVGGVWARASDPVVAFGADGSVYISTLVLDLACPGGVTVSRSTDGGETFAPPVIVHKSTSCAYSDDKDWMVVDRQPDSPFYGRIYVFWTPFISNSNGAVKGSPQAVRWSDDDGAQWSATSYVTGLRAATQDSQPMIQPDGSITDVYQYFPNQSAVIGSLRARTSRDGGSTWSNSGVVTPSFGGGATGVRCCLPGATADFVTGELYAAWIANNADETVEVARSSDGVHWSAPLAVTSTGSHIQHVNLAVGAYNGEVFVSYGNRNMNHARKGGRAFDDLLTVLQNPRSATLTPRALASRRR